jgi:replicative DNA helicase
MTDLFRPNDISPLARLVRRADTGPKAHLPPDSFATGFPSVDKFLGGGVRRGDLVVLGGAPGSGKSALALAMALRMAQAGVRAAYLTSELSVERVLERALAIEGHCRVDDIRQGTLDDETRASVAAAAIRVRDATPVFELLPAGGPAALAESVRGRVPKLDVAFVDPLQALAPGMRARDEELATAVLALKRIALDAGIAVVLTSQLEPAGAARADQRPALDDFGVLGAVQQHADVVAGIFREEMFDPGSGIEGATELIIRKNRNGATGYVDLYFYKQWMRFEDMLEQ